MHASAAASGYLSRQVPLSSAPNRSFYVAARVHAPCLVCRCIIHIIEELSFASCQLLDQGVNFWAHLHKQVCKETNAKKRMTALLLKRNSNLIPSPVKEGTPTALPKSSPNPHHLKPGPAMHLCLLPPLTPLLLLAPASELNRFSSTSGRALGTTFSPRPKLSSLALRIFWPVACGYAFCSPASRTAAQPQRPHAQPPAQHPRRHRSPGCPQGGRGDPTSSEGPQTACIPYHQLKQPESPDPDNEDRSSQLKARTLPPLPRLC